MLNKADVAQLPINLLVPHYLLASFCYYRMDQSPMTDDAFDYLCQRALANYDSIKHIHKPLMDRESLEAGTCMLAYDEYPSRVQNGAEQYLQACQSGALMQEIRGAAARSSTVIRRVRRAPAVQPSTPTKPSRILRRRRG